MYDHLHPTETMQRIARKELGDRLDEILEIVSRDNVGFVITDAGKDDLVLWSGKLAFTVGKRGIRLHRQQCCSLFPWTGHLHAGRCCSIHS